MFLLPTPPKESMGTKPRKLQEIMFNFSNIQFEMLKAALVEFEGEEFDELNEDEKSIFNEVFNTQIASYDQMQTLISEY